MDECHIEGSLILETLVENGTLDVFYEAIDSDDFLKAKRILENSGFDAETIQWVLSEMAEGE